MGPDLKPLPLNMRQVAPGRYTGSFDADQAGSYLVNVIPGPGMPPLTTGASVPYSDEYRIRRTNYTLLEQLTNLKPSGGEAGKLSPMLEGNRLTELLSHNVYRSGLPKAMSMQDVWPWCLLLGSLCLFGDIFVRRVALDYAYPAKWVYAKLFGKTISAQDQQRQASLERLRMRKSEVAVDVEQSRADIRFESDNAGDTSVLDEAMSGKKQNSDTTRSASPGMTNEPEQQGYTARLLAAKKAAKRKADEENN